MLFLQKFIKYHMLPKPIYSAALNNKRYTTAEGHFLDVRIKGEKEILVNDASVTDVDISGSNGVIHAIGKVLMPVSGAIFFFFSLVVVFSPQSICDELLNLQPYCLTTLRPTRI